MTHITDEEWVRVQEALVKGGLRECIDDIVASRCPDGFEPVLSAENRLIIAKAYDDGDGNTITLVSTDDPPWFAGLYEDQEVMLGLDHRGTLHSIVPLSGGGLVSVIVGRGLIDNDTGIVFQNVGEAKAYVKGLTAAK